jgi:phosphatidate cytidylyltransferase
MIIETNTEFRPQERSFKKMFPTLALRVLVAVIGIPLILGAVWLGGWWLTGLVAAVSTIGLWEFYRLADAKGIRPYRWWGLILGLLLILGIHLSEHRYLAFFYDAYGYFMLCFLAALCVLVFQKDIKDSLNRIAVTAFGICYVPLLLGHMIPLRESHALCLFSDRMVGQKLLLLTFVLVWLNDTGAYFTGMLLGKRPLVPHISPKKSVEGLIGGVLVTVIAAVVIQHYVLSRVALLNIIVIALGVSVIGTVGDLVESVFKRDSGIKDSGTILPGHGGVLDRFDSLLFAVPFVYWYYRLVMFR